MKKAMEYLSNLVFVKDDVVAIPNVELTKFSEGDYVRPKKQFSELDKQYFHGHSKRVIRVENVYYPYAGNQFVYIEWAGNEVGLYANALEKEN